MKNHYIEILNHVFSSTVLSNYFFDFWQLGAQLLKYKISNGGHHSINIGLKFKILFTWTCSVWSDVPSQRNCHDMVQK